MSAARHSCKLLQMFVAAYGQAIEVQDLLPSAHNSCSGLDP